MNKSTKTNSKILLFLVNVDWFFLSHRLDIALSAKKSGWEVHIATKITNRLSELESFGFVVHPLLLEREGMNPLNALRSARQVWKIYRLVKPNVVHSVTIKPVILGGVIARLAGVPALVSAVPGLGSGFTAEGFGASLKRWVVRRGYQIALGHRNQKVIFQNSNDRAVLTKVAHLKSRDIVTINGSGVDLARFKPEPLPVGIPVIVLASRLLWNKGVQEFIDAARIMRERGVLARFVLVGTPDSASPTCVSPEKVESWVSEGIVECWGHRKDMETVLAQSNIVVLPSYSEGMPKILLEAAACGRPVVTTDVAGCREAIQCGVTGLLVAPKDAIALADAVEKLLMDVDLASSMGVMGRALAEREFDVREVVRKHLSIYLELNDRLKDGLGG